MKHAGFQNLIRKAGKPVSLGMMILLAGCNNGAKQKPVHDPNMVHKPVEVSVHILSDPESLHPFNANSVAAFTISGQLYQALTSIDFKTLKLVPVLVKERATMHKIKEGSMSGGLQFDFEIREEAKWDDGQPIMATDVAFSLRALKDPMLNDEGIRLSYADLDSVGLNTENPRKFSIYSRENSIRAEATAGAIVILPEHILDPKQTLRSISIHTLNDDSPEGVKRLTANKALKDFADKFNSDPYSREADHLIGSGPYILDQWKPGEYVRLRLKKDWWGKKLSSSNTAFEANADVLDYRVIADPQAALRTIQAGKIDVMYQIPPQDFEQLEHNDAFKKKYQLYTPDELGYTCITMNLKNPKLSDIRVREALESLVKSEYIVNNIMLNTASVTHSMEHPANKATYNTDIKYLGYDPARAEKLLSEAGWKDSDKDGVVDKVIKGKKTQLSLDLLLNTGNPAREKIARLIQSEAAKVGIRITIIPKELRTVTELQMKHQFEMSFNGWVSTPLPYDPKPIWHSIGITEGQNFMQYSSPVADQLIDSIRLELDEPKRIDMFKRFQQLVAQDVPVLFLYAYKGRLAINKRFDNAYPSTMRPGFNEAGFTVSGE